MSPGARTDRAVATITIDRRFTGPADSGNGGYTAGRLAVAVSAATRTHAVRVRLRQPPPLGAAMQVQPADAEPGSMRLLLGGALIAEAVPAALDADPVEPVPAAAAAAAETSYAGLTRHPFPRCFTCGTDREPGDALLLRPGRIEHGRTACTWLPDESLTDHGSRHVRAEFVWAALDCPGGWTADIEGRPMVLGTMTAQVDAPVEVGERHVVMGQLLGQEGRRTLTASTVYDSDGRVAGRAAHVWVTVDVTSLRQGRSV